MFNLDDKVNTIGSTKKYTKSACKAVYQRYAAKLVNNTYRLE